MGVLKAGADLLLIGHVTQDLLEARPGSAARLGGGVSFGAATAARLGRRPAIVTRAGPEADLSELPPQAELHVLPAEVTTTFANVYTPVGRVQYCFAAAAPIRATDIPRRLTLPKAVLLAPLVNEIGPDVVRLFQGQTLLAAVPQGWMRRWDESGRVQRKPWDNADEILPALDVLILSGEDIGGDLTQLRPFADRVPLVVLTRDRRGCVVYRRAGGQVEEVVVPSRPAAVVDPTGAGDVFATAFVLRLQETGDAIAAARFANVTASLSIEAEGLAAIPTREQVLAYLAAHPMN